MYYPPANPNKHCRWCRKRYYAHKPYDGDGFCSAACKQAHYRAYKKYVTAKTSNRAAAGSKQVTRKTHATPKATQGKKRKKNE